jgi:uncharacterized protein
MAQAGCFPVLHDGVACRLERVTISLLLPDTALIKLLLDENRRLRNGWWVLVFVLLFLVSRAAYTPLSRILKQIDSSGQWLEPLRFVFVLLVTWVCTRLRRESLSSVGFHINGRWLGQMFCGTLLGMGMMLAIVGMIWAVGGVRLNLDPSRSVATLGYGLYLFLCVALFEETLFRGFLFQRMVDGIGFGGAQLALALLFAVGHWGNPGMQGATEVFATLDLGLGAIMLGLAWRRTSSLALPIGLHLGWNWMQGHVLGFGVSGFDYAGWFQPAFAGLPQWLTGGEFGPESSVIAVFVDAVAIFLLWRWKGVAGASPASNRTPFGSETKPA